MGCILNEKQKYHNSLRDSINETVDLEGYEDGRSAWTTWISDNFYDAEQIIKAIDENGGQLPFSFSLDNTSTEVEKVGKVIQEGTNIDAEREYLRRQSFGQYKKLRSTFKKAIVASTLFSITEGPDGTWKTSLVKRDVESSKYPGVNTLNQNIFEYKMSLVKTIGDFTGTNFDTQYISPEQMTRLILNAIQDFETHDTLEITNKKYQKALDAFVILKTFDDLLETEVDFIKSNSPKGIHRIDQYEYVGPKAVHLNNYSDESADIHATTSKLQKIILSYLPIITVDKEQNQHLDWNYSVEGEGGGFDIVVTEFKDWVSNLMWNDPIKQGILKRDIQSLEEAFNKFIESYGQTANRGQSKYILDRARSIKEFIWSPKSKLAQEIKDMFRMQLFKTVRNSYVSYRIKNGRSESFKLNEQFLNVQSLALQENVRCMQGTYRANPARYEELKDRWGIEVGMDDIVIGRKKNIGLSSPITIKLTTTKTGVEGQNSRLSISSFRDKALSELSDTQKSQDNQIAAELISDILQTTIPSNYNEILNQLSRGANDLMLLEQFVEPIGLLIAAVENIGGINNRAFRDKERTDFKVNSYANIFTSSATFLSLAFGTDIRTVLHNQEGNNIPSSGLTSMGAQTPELIASLDERFSTVNEENPIVNAIKSTGSEAVKHTVIRTDSSYGKDTVKASRSLSVSELGFIEIMDDFLGNLWKEDSTKNIVEKKSNTSSTSSDILLQFTTTSDKSTHPLLPIDLTKVLFDDKTGLEIFRDICSIDHFKDGSKKAALKAEKIIQDHIIKYRQARINDQVAKLVNQFNEIIPELGLTDDLSTREKLDKIDTEIRSWSSNRFFEIRDRFVKKGYDFISEIHYSKVKDKSKFSKGKWCLNETLLHYFDTYNNPEAAKSRFARQLIQTIKELEKNDVQLPVGLNTYAISQLGGEAFSNKWIGVYSNNLKHYIMQDSTGKPVSISEVQLSGNEVFEFNKEIIKINDEQGNLLYKVEINPVIKSYFYANAYWGNAYKDLTLGDCFDHATKYTATDADYNSDGTRKESYFTHNEASREGNGFKRAVIVGATHHPFNFSSKYGVSKYLNVAVIQDLAGTVWNLAGLEKDDLDSMDGSGLSSPYQAILENWSLEDASVGLDKKTIFGDIDPLFGGQRLLKWAVYAITNSRRRMSWGSDIRLQDVFERMHNKKISLEGINLSKYYNLDGRISSDMYKQITYTKPLFFKDEDGTVFMPGQIDSIPGRHFKILAISNNGSECKRILQEVDTSGKPIGDIFEDPMVVETLADLDNLFGGAWVEELDSNNKLQFSEVNNDIIANFICNEKKHDAFTGYLVNESAMKVGVANINTSNKWYSGSLDTFKMSLAFGGVQMDPDHELDLAQVTEMSQMISALIQNGYMTDVVNEIYSDIGKVALEGISDIKEGLMSGDKDRVYRIIGKALMDSLNSESSDTMGLAKSFVTKATEYFNKEKIDYKIPFSSGNINSKFIATVISMINKKGIRRKYSGIAAVLVPSHNMIEYYRLGNKTYMYTELSDILKASKVTRTDEFGSERPWTVKEALTDIGYDLNNNPTNPFIQPIDYQDIDIEDTILYRVVGSGEEFTIDKIDSYQKLDYYRNLLKSKGSFEVYNWTIKPKNLRQANGIITLELDGAQYKMSIYDLDSVRANHYIDNFVTKITDPETQQVTKAFSLNLVKDDLKRLAIKNALDHIYLVEPKFTYTDETLFSPKQLKSLLAKLTQYELKQLQKGNTLYWNSCLPFGDEFNIINYEFRAAEMVLGRLHAKELGLSKSDTISSVQTQGIDFFKEKLKQYYSFPSRDIIKPESFDLMLVGEDGKKTLVVLGKQEDVVRKFADYTTLTSTNDYYQVGNMILYKDQEFCRAGGVDFNKCIAATGETFDVISIESIDKLTDILNTSGLFSDVEYNYKPGNWKELFRYQHSDVVNKNYDLLEDDAIEISIVDPKTRKLVSRSLYNNLDTFMDLSDRVKFQDTLDQQRQVLTESGLSEEEINSILLQMKDEAVAKQAIPILQQYHEANLGRKIETKARLQYESFLKQLDYVGARIPTQSMQSFMALRLVGFSDSDTNDVYVPKSQTWLQGSDYDIDKLYILSYSIGEDGVLRTLSNLEKELPIEQVLELPIPDGKTYKIGKPIRKVVAQLFKNGNANDMSPRSYNHAKTVELNDLVDVRVYRKSWRDDPSKWNSTVSFELKSKPGQYFELVQDTDLETGLPNNEYSIHFKTSGPNALNQKEKDLLFATVADALPVGAKLSTWGSVSNGGIHGLFRFLELGFIPTSETRVLSLKDSATVEYIKNNFDQVVFNEDGTITVPVLEKISNKSVLSIDSLSDPFEVIKKVLTSGMTQVYFDDDKELNGKEQFLSNIEQLLNLSDKEARISAWSALVESTENRFKAGLDLDRVSEIVEISDINTRLKQWNDFAQSTSTEPSWAAKNSAEKKYSKDKKNLLRLINLHSQSKGKFKGSTRESGLRNQVVSKVLKVTSNPVNQNNSMNPINMDQQQAAAEKSSLGNDEKEMLLDSPLTKIIMQIQNMVGKEVIGISAVMLKNFFAASCHANIQLQKIADALQNKQYDTVFNLIQTIVFENNFESESYNYSPHLSTLANLNFDDVIKVIENNNITFISIKNTEVPDVISSLGDYISGNLLNIRKLVYDLQASADRIDASDSISGLLSAATDNAKELILSKINATSMFADIYGHLLMSGVEFGAIADFMMSPIMNVVARFAKPNMFDPISSSVTLKNVVQFVMNERQLGNINALELNNILLTWWRDDKNITDKSFLPKLVYEIDENGNLLKDKNGKLIPRKKVLTLNIGGKKINMTPEKLKEFFETTVQTDGSYTLTKNARELRDNINDILLDNNVIDILIKHLNYLKAQLKVNKPRFAQDDVDQDFDAFDYYDFSDESGEREEFDDSEYDDYRDIEYRKIKSEPQDPTKVIGGKLSEQNFDAYIKYFDFYVRLRNDLLNQKIETSDGIVRPISQMNKLDYLLNQIMPATEEQKTLGSMLGANQGLRTNDYDLYSFEAKISTFVNKRYNEYNEAHVEDKLDSFNLMDFINNEHERQKQIRQYEKVKSKINILDTISSVPHFREMFNMTAIGETLIGQAARNRFERVLISRILKDNTLKLVNSEFSIVQNFVSQVLTLNWILSKGIKVNIPEKQQYYDAENFVELKTVPLGESKQIILDSAENIATFKHWMDDYVIPTLRRNSKISSGAFIKSLTYQMVPSKVGGMMNVYKFPFNPMNVSDNPTLEAQWNEIVNNFNSIAQNKLSDYGIDSDLTLMDALYLYNLITFGDRFSQSSMTRLFEDVNLKFDSSLVNDYNEWLSKLDSSEISLNDIKYDLVDLLYMLSGQKSAENKFNVTQEPTKSEKSIKLNLKTKSDSKPVQITISKEHSADFTFDLPIQLGFTYEGVDDKIVAYREKQSQNIVRYELNDADVIRTIVQSLQDKFKGVKIHIVDNSTLNEMYAGNMETSIEFNGEDSLQRMKEAKAFISGGEIYVNIDNATAGSAFHEYMHIAAACLKFNDDPFIRELYYDLLDKVQVLYKKEYPTEYKKVASKYEDVNGSDFNEELLVRLLEARFTKRLSETWGVAKDNIPSLEDAVESALANVLELNPENEGTINISRLSVSRLDDILRFFNSSLFDFNKSGIGIDQVRKSEELMTLKRKLVESGELTYEQCK